MSKEIEDEVWMDDESYYLLKCSKLEKKLEIAVKALKEYETTETHDWIDSRIVAHKALKEMEEV